MKVHQRRRVLRENKFDSFQDTEETDVKAITLSLDQSFSSTSFKTPRRIWKPTTKCKSFYRKPNNNKSKERNISIIFCTPLKSVVLINVRYTSEHAMCVIALSICPCFPCLRSRCSDMHFNKKLNCDSLILICWALAMKNELWIWKGKKKRDSMQHSLHFANQKIESHLLWKWKHKFQLFVTSHAYVHR